MADAEPRVLCLTDEDALLLEALAFIGDLGVDGREEDAPGIPDSAHSALALAAPATPVRDAFTQAFAASASIIQENQVKNAASLPAVVPEFRAPLKWPRESRTEPELNPEAKSSISNKSRVRRREELLYLRGLVGDLEERLSSLRNTPNDGTDEASLAAAGTPNELVGAWEHVAGRQYEQRQQSERENIKLRRLLNDQIRLGKTLERLLMKKRPNVETFDQEAAAEKRMRRSHSRSPNTQLVFEELLANCEALYADTARVTAKFDAIPSVKPRREAQLVHDPLLGLTVQTTEQRIIPFGWEFTADVVWSCFPEGSTVHHFQDYLNKDLTDDTMKLHFRVTSDIGLKRSEFAITMALRRYTEADRTVITVSAVFDPTEVQETDMAGVRMRHSGWHIAQQIPGHAVRSPRAATNLCVHHISVPDVDGDLKDEARKVGTLSNFLLGAIAVEMDSRNQNLDDRLLEHSLTKSRLDA